MVKRGIIGSALAIAVVAGVVSAISLARSPVLGAALARPYGQPSLPAEPAHPAVEPSRQECLSSTAFIDYAPDARGQATPAAAVRSYWPRAENLEVHILAPGHAVVEEFKGTIKVAAYVVFRIGKGWLVVQADSYGLCDSAGWPLTSLVAPPGFERFAS
jgi:hypothetical protein